MPDFTVSARVVVDGASTAASQIDSVSAAVDRAKGAASSVSGSGAESFVDLGKAAVETGKEIAAAAAEASSAVTTAAAEAEKATTEATEEAGKKSTDALQSLRQNYDQVYSDLAEKTEAFASTFGAVKTAAQDYLRTTVPAYEEEQRQLRSWTVQLNSATAAAEKLAEAKRIAAESSFDLASLRKAQQALVNVGVQGEGALRSVALAAQATNRDLETTAQTMARALAGSSRGFMQLQYGYGVKAEDLQKYGAEISPEGSVLTDTAEQAEKARRALQALAQERWGEAFAASADSVTQASHDAQEQIETLRGNIGEDLSGAVKVGKAVLEGFFAVLNEVPAPIRKIVVLVGSAVAAVTALGLAVPALATAIGSLTAAFTAFSGGAGALVLALTSPAGLIAALTALTALVAAGGTYGINKWAEGFLAEAARVKQAADVMTEARNALSGAAAKKIGEVYEESGEAGVKAFMAANGWGPEAVAEQLQKIEAFKKSLRAEIQRLQEELGGASGEEKDQLQSALDNAVRQYRVYGGAGAALRASGYKDVVVDNSEELKKQAEAAAKAEAEAKSEAEKRLQAEKQISAELDAQELAALKAEQAALYKKTDRSEAEQSRLQELRGEILSAEEKAIAARIERQAEGIDKASEAYSKLLRLQGLYVKKAEEAQDSLAAQDAERLAKAKVAEEQAAAKTAEEQARLQQRVTAELQKQELLRLRAERDRLKAAGSLAEAAAVEKKIEDILKAQTEDDFLQRFGDVEKGTKAYADLLKARELAIASAIEAERKLQTATEEAGEAEKDSLKEQIRLIREKYAEKQKALQQDSEAARALKNAEAWEVKAAEDKAAAEKKASGHMTWRQYREREAAIYENFRTQSAGLSRGSAAYSDLVKSRDWQLGSLAEEYRTGRSPLPAAMDTAAQQVQTGAESVQSGLSGLSSALQAGTVDVQSGLDTLAAALRSASVSASAAGAGRASTSNSYTVNVDGRRSGRSVDSDQIAVAAARMVAAERKRSSFFAG